MNIPRLTRLGGIAVLCLTLASCVVDPYYASAPVRTYRPSYYSSYGYSSYPYARSYGYSYPSYRTGVAISSGHYSYYPRHYYRSSHYGHHHHHRATYHRHHGHHH